MGEYRVILADPPWQYGCFPPGKKVRRENRRNVSPAAVQYQTLTLDALCQVHIDDWASNDAALFMWATMPCLPEAFDLMRAWDFTYKTVAFTWVKRNHDGSPFKGLGHYTRSNAEVCLLGIRGRMERKARDVAQVILSPRREHSRKPDEQYERIMRLFDGPYLELFARQRWPGWDVWGNETDRFEAEASSYAEAEAMTLKAVYACDGCGRMEATDSEAAHGWVQVFRPGQVTTSDRHFCGFRCLEDFARVEQERVARERTVDDRADEPGATQPGTKPLKRVGVFRASHGKHGNADEAHDAEVIHKGSLPAEERAE